MLTRPAKTARPHSQDRSPARSLLRTAAVAASLAAALQFAGCAANTHARSDISGEPAPASGVVLADVAYPLAAGEKHFSFERSTLGGIEQVRVVRTSVPQDNGTWLVHTEQFDEANPGGERISSNRYARTGRGVALLEVLDYISGTQTVFLDGGLLVMPTTARPEGLYSSSVTVEIFDIGQPGTIRQHGTARRDIEFLAREPVTTPAGTFQAARLRSTLLMRLTTANVTQTDHLWIDDQLGIVAEDSRMQARSFGVPVRNRSKLLLLAEVPAAWNTYQQPIGSPQPETMIERTGPVDPPPPPPPGVMQRMR